MPDKIYRINMTDLKVTNEEVPEQWKGLGGRGLTSTIVAQEVKPTCHPLGKYNKLVFAPGLLSGTTCANSGRLSAGAKSPLTGGIKECNAGGTAAANFARLGIKVLIIDGLPEKDTFYSLKVDKNGVTIKEETELGGKGNYEVVKNLTEKLGKKIGIISMGPVGEMRLAAANISVRTRDDYIRSLGRGGLGAVMGSKKIKYITIDDSDTPGVPIADPKKFKAAGKIFAKALAEHPVSGGALKNYGTDVLVNILNEAGGLPTKNFRYGKFAGHEKISGETMHDTIAGRSGKVSHGCHTGCVIQCSQVYNDKDQKYMTSGFEYETIWAFGADCCIDDLDVIAQADHLMDDIGVDSIETGVMIGVAMEAGIIPFGDGQGMLGLLKEIGSGTPLGRILGCGAAAVGKAYGITRVPVVKNQGIPAYDPRSVKGIGITYATSPMGADHTAGYTIATNILKVGGFVDPLKKEGQIELSRNLQIATAFIDSTGLCIFVAFPIIDIPAGFTAMVDMVNARFGISLTADDITKLGKQILRTEHEFNLAAGFTNKNDRLPEFFEDPVLPHNAVWDFTDEEIDSFWNF
ncbi:MAG: aldehyde ferredoxin oxidoreductase [Thermodesulfobacteriota bacterium]|jgi:aldehyde:ferredoxin oxidoreductase|nr:MAG: aldehyde ferredoxin oxidoreductase [Thermodesulfobacteriota bacterium]